MTMQKYKIIKNETLKCEIPKCSNWADYRIYLQRLDTESEICICESCCENLFCYDEKAEYDPKKEI